MPKKKGIEGFKRKLGGRRIHDPERARFPDTLEDTFTGLSQILTSVIASVVGGVPSTA
jgi:hypothetical protein